MSNGNNRIQTLNDEFPFCRQRFTAAIDLVKLSRRLVSYCQVLNGLSKYLGPDGSAVLQSLASQRYERLWLPLAAENRLFAGAPLDVQWMWTAHMLDPQAYRLDCIRLTGKLVEHRLVSDKRVEQMTEKAKKFWQMHYPTERFEFNPDRNDDVLNGGWIEKIKPVQITLNFSWVAQTHPHFFHQVSLPHYSEISFLERSVDRYERYLHVQYVLHQLVQNPKRLDFSDPYHTSAPKVNYLPSDIELVWRAHLLHPNIYSKDTSPLFGRPLRHPLHFTDGRSLTPLDQLPQNNIGGSINIKHHSESVKIWYNLFPEQPLFVPGSFERGVISPKRFGQLEQRDLYHMATKCVHIQLTHVELSLMPGDGKYKLRIDQLPEPFNEQCTGGRDVVNIFKLETIQTDERNKASPMVEFTAISGISDLLIVKVNQKRRWILASDPTVYYAHFSVREAIEHHNGTESVELTLCETLQKDEWNQCHLKRKTTVSPQASSVVHKYPGKPFTDESIEDSPDHLNLPAVRLRLILSPPASHAFRFQVKVGPAFIAHPMGQPALHGSRTVEHVTNHQLDPSRERSEQNFRDQNEDRVLLLNHSVVNHMNEEVFTARVVHNLEQNKSTVRIYHQEILQCQGMTIGFEHLPKRDKLSQKVKAKRKSRSHLPPSKGESEHTSQHSDKSTGYSGLWGLDPEKEERAMLIEDAKGDWGLIIARWTGLRRCPEPDYSSAPPECEEDNVSRTKGSAGYLALRMWRSSAETQKTNFAQIPDRTNAYSFLLPEAAINLRTGEIHISSLGRNISQYVCLAFCCGILHVLCQPRNLVMETIKGMPKSTGFSIGREVPISPHPVRTTYRSESEEHLDGRKGDCALNGETENKSHPTSLEWFVDPISIPYRVDQYEVIGTAKLRCVQHVQRGTNSHREVDEVCCQMTLMDFFQIMSKFETFLDTSPPVSRMETWAKRGILASFNFVMCRAAGLPIDSLIPSVQYRRFCERIKSSMTGNESSKSDQNEPKRGTDLFRPNGVRGAIQPTTGFRGITPSTTAESTPFIDWSLKDFYDYFVLNLPDICSGCLGECQYCKGISY